MTSVLTRTTAVLDPCPGCGALLRQSPGPAHRYLGASPACWAAYGELLAAGAARPPQGELLVDAYAAQHPGIPSPQAIHSVGVHLLTLYAVLERGYPVAEAMALRQRVVRPRGGSPWLVPPNRMGRLTVSDLGGPDAAESARQLDRYITGVWSSWASVYRETIAGWHARLLAQSHGSGPQPDQGFSRATTRRGARPPSGGTTSGPTRRPG